MRSIDCNELIVSLGAVCNDQRVAALCDLVYANGARAGQQPRDGRFVEEFERALARRRSEALKVLAAARVRRASVFPLPRVPIDPAALAEFEQYVRNPRKEPWECLTSTPASAERPGYGISR